MAGVVIRRVPTLRLSLEGKVESSRLCSKSVAFAASKEENIFARTDATLLLECSSLRFTSTVLSSLHQSRKVPSLVQGQTVEAQLAVPSSSEPQLA